MAIDPRLSLEVKSPDVMGNAKLGTDLAYEQQNNPIRIQQAQTNLEFDQANNPTLLKRNQADLQSTLTQNERDRLALQQEQRANEFKLFLNRERPGFDPVTGKTDHAQAVGDSARAGFTEFGLGYAKNILDTDAAAIKNNEDRLAVVDKAVNMASNIYNASPKNTPEEIQRLKTNMDNSRAYIKDKLGIDPAVTHGPDWYTLGRSSSIGPTEQVANESTRQAIEVSKQNNYMDDASKDPNSQLNVEWRRFAAEIAPGMQLPGTLYEANRVPGAATFVDKFSISAETRASSAQTATQAAAVITGVDDLLSRSKSLGEKFPFKPGEKLKNVYKGITNDADRAELDAWVADAEKIIGRPVDRDQPVSGVMKTLELLKNQASVAGKQARSQVGATSYARTPAGGYAPTDQAAPSPAGQTEAAPATTPASQKEGAKLAGTYVATRGRFMGQKQTFTAEQLSNPENAAKLKAHIASGMLKRL